MSDSIESKDQRLLRSTIEHLLAHTVGSKVTEIIQWLIDNVLELQSQEHDEKAKNKEKEYFSKIERYQDDIRALEIERDELLMQKTNQDEH